MLGHLINSLRLNRNLFVVRLRLTECKQRAKGQNTDERQSGAHYFGESLYGQWTFPSWIFVAADTVSR